MSSHYILGIDPGLSGGMAIIEPGIPNLIGPKVIDAAMAFSEKRGKRSEINPSLTADFIRPYTKNIKFAVIEDVSAMPGQGVVSMFTFGKVMGVVQGVLGVFGTEIYYTPPSVWKSVLGLDFNKSSSLKMATQVFEGDKFWPLKKHDGVAEAALLAYFGIRFLGD